MRVAVCEEGSGGEWGVEDGGNCVKVQGGGGRRCNDVLCEFEGWGRRSYGKRGESRDGKSEARLEFVFEPESGPKGGKGVRGCKGIAGSLTIAVGWWRFIKDGN